MCASQPEALLDGNRIRVGSARLAGVGAGRGELRQLRPAAVARTMEIRESKEKREGGLTAG